MNAEPQTAAPPAARGAGVPALTGAVTRATPAATAGTLTGTLGLAAACWAIAVWRMHGMDMGPRPGSARPGAGSSGFHGAGELVFQSV